jgi:hypothetical protein
MTRSEADERCTALNREPGEAGTRWMAREASPGEWSAARVRVPGAAALRPFKATQESRPRPPEPADPRSGLARNVPPYG